ncbi:two component transcriptional regulator [Calothrix sp. NIES-2098]|nr:two component transcriptional regulator [Calothrix sp. NIES-2098]
MIGKKILVVDDDPPVRNLIQRFLTKLNYQVEAAADGKTARAIFQNFHPDLVILDVTLPNENISDICEEIQVIGEAFVLLLTKNLDAGIKADDYLAKPFDLGQLEAKVTKILQGRNDNNWG